MRQAVEDAVRRHRLVAILRGVPPEHVVLLGEALVEGGLRLVEVTLSHAGGLDGVRALREALAPEAIVGAGTVVTLEDARAALEAGAQFLVTPNLEPAVVRFAFEHDLAVLPGVMTPTEIAQARALGCRILKLFPAGALGPDYVRAVRGPYPDLELLVVGGIGRENLADYLRAGALGAGIGGALTDQDWGKPDFERARALAEGLVATARDAAGPAGASPPRERSR